MRANITRSWLQTALEYQLTINKVKNVWNNVSESRNSTATNFIDYFILTISGKALKGQEKIFPASLNTFL